MAVDEEIDQICLEVEDQLREGKCVIIEDYVARIDDSRQGCLLRYLILLEIDYRADTDPELKSAEYWRTRFPGHEDDIASALSECAKLVWNPVSVGSRIGRYIVHEKLGEGNFGSVYKARDEEMERWVALKAPCFDSEATESSATALCQEIRSLANLRHPNVVVVYDVLRDQGGWPWMVLEYFDSGSLIVESDPGKLVQDLISVTRGLQYIHQQGIVHRDLKPANILKDASGRTCIADFGLAFQYDKQCERSGPSAGTLNYMSPEQVLGDPGWTDGRADIWAVGVILYRGLCGQVPFANSDQGELKEAILAQPPRPPRQINPAAPAELERICLKCLAKSPDDRYPTAGDLAADLERFQNGEFGLGRFFPWLAGGVAVAALIWAVAMLPQSGAVALVDEPRTQFEVEDTVQEFVSEDHGLATQKVSAVEFSSDFETSVAPWIPSGHPTLTLVDDGFEGNRSVRIDDRSKHYYGIAVDLMNQVAPSKIYLVCSHLKSVGNEFAIQMQLETKDCDGMHYPTLGIAEVSQDWTDIVGTFKFQEDLSLESMRLVFRSLPSRSIGNFLNPFQMDAVSIVELQVRGSELIRNSEFDDGLARWYLPDDESAILEPIEYEDGRAMLVRDRQSSIGGPCQRVKVALGTRYYFQARVRATHEGDSHHRIMIRSLDKEPYVERVGMLNTNPDQWRIIDGSFEAKYSELEIWVESDGATTDDFMVDMVSIVPVQIGQTIVLK